MNLSSPTPPTTTKGRQMTNGGAILEGIMVVVMFWAMYQLVVAMLSA
jgi:hypothetical protein